jgi:hypothetical protein
MSAIVYQLDKRSGITYAYESVSYWDKDKKQSRAKRTLIGKVDKNTNEIISTDGDVKKINKHKLICKLLYYLQGNIMVLHICLIRLVKNWG